MPTPSKLPTFIYGLYDIGGQDHLLEAGRPGWVLDMVDLHSQAGADYSSLSKAGSGVIVCLNHGLYSGTVPPSDRYDAFAARCAEYVANSPGAHIWIIGNEMNARAERPRLADDMDEVITPDKYARCFTACRTAIKKVTEHADDWVIPGAVATGCKDTTYPGNPTGDWVQYLADVLHLAGAADGIALHLHTREMRPEQITDDRRMSVPFENRNAGLRAYRDFIQAFPRACRTLPVFITEAVPSTGWEDANHGWIQEAYKEIDAWNADRTHQPVQALVLYRWQASPVTEQWSIQTKPALLADFQSALSAGYRVRWPTAQPEMAKTTAAAIAPDSMPEPIRPPARNDPASAAVAIAAAPAAVDAPAPTLTPTPSPDPWAALFVGHDTPVSLTVGQAVFVNLSIKNVGTNTWLRSGPPPVHVGYKWFNTSGQQQWDVDDRRTALKNDLAANETTQLGAVLVAPKTPGHYNLRWDLIVEGLAWFADAGNPPLVIPVSVTALPCDVSGWRVESNLNPTQVAYALDGDTRTYWESHAPQAPGQWFRLNLSTPRMMDGIQFISPGKGYPGPYILRVSADGRTWTEIVRVTSENAHDVMAVFAPIPVQYAQVDLIAEPASASSWMISEILVHPAVTWSATASDNTERAPLALDNDAATGWTSGAPQIPGMWFQIDLGKEETVSGLMLEAMPGEDPLAFRVATWNARAGRWQIACDQTDNHAALDVVFAATETQFINIQLLQPAEQPWSIRRAHVHREMDAWLRPGG